MWEKSQTCVAEDMWGPSLVQTSFESLPYIGEESEGNYFKIKVLNIDRSRLKIIVIYPRTEPLGTTYHSCPSQL